MYNRDWDLRQHRTIRSIQKIFAECDRNNIVRVTAVYKAIHGLDSPVNAVIAKLTGSKTYHSFALFMQFKKIDPVESMGEDISVVGMHTGSAVLDEFVKDACGRTIGRSEILVRHGVICVSCEIGEYYQRIAVKYRFKKQIHSTGLTLYLENVLNGLCTEIRLA